MANELAEFERNYEQCLFRVMLPVSGLPRPFLFGGFQNSGANVVGTTFSKGLLQKAIKFNTKEFFDNLDPIIPTRGYINIEEGVERTIAAYLTIAPMRQYRKALSIGDGVTDVTFLGSGSPSWQNFIREKYGDISNWHIKLVAFQLAQTPIPQYKATISGAVRRVEEGESVSEAISRFFAISLIGNCVYPVLFHRGTKIGVFHEGVLYATSALYPFRDFFMKRWNTPLRSISDAPKSKEFLKRLELAKQGLHATAGTWIETGASASSTITMTANWRAV